MTRARTRTAHPLTPRQAVMRALARAAGLVLVLYLGANIAAYALHGLVHPLLTLRGLVQEKHQLEHQKAEKLRQVREKRELLSWYRTPAGADELAHTKGLVRPGERTVLILPPPPPEPAAAAPARPLARAELTPALGFSALSVVTCLLIYFTLLWRRRRLLRVRQEAGVLTPRKQLLRRRRANPLAEEG